MNGHDDEYFESIALLALGVLPGVEATDLAAHIATCVRCRAEYTNLRGAADLVGYQEEAVGASLDEMTAHRLKARVMHAVRGSGASEPLVAPSNGTVAKRAAARPQRYWLPWTVAAAAIVIAAIDTVSNTSLRADNDRLGATATQQASVAEANATQMRELDRRLAGIVAPGGKHFAIPQGEIVATGSRTIIAMRDLPALPAGKTYQAWTLKRGARDMTPGTLFGPDASGVAFVEMPLGANDISAVAVSVEPASGSKAPTSKPTFIRSLT